MKFDYKLILTGLLLMLLQACGNGQQPAESGAADTPAAGPTRTASPPGATVFIISPVNGATLTSPVEVKFGISGMAVAPAGDYSENTGHHHLLVDTELEDMNLPVPTSDNHIHFGKGQTETTVTLEPGQHTLQLVLGDGNHIPHDPPVMSERITITVE